MEELIEKVDNLINKIDSLDLINDIKYLNDKVMKDKKLLELIEKYQASQDVKIRDEIISNDLFRKYKHKESEVNFLIMGLNQELKKINGGRFCSK